MTPQAPPPLDPDSRQRVARSPARIRNALVAWFRRGGPAKRDRKTGNDEKQPARGWWDTVKTVLIALLIAGFFRTFVVQPFHIPSGSMKETLLIGDFLFTSKFAYGFSRASCPKINAVGLDLTGLCKMIEGGDGRLFGSPPKRGDVVVFLHPVHNQEYIKRVIGLPGDTIQLRGAAPYINGQPVEQVADGLFTEVMERQGGEGNLPKCASIVVSNGVDQCVKLRSIERLPNGVAYKILRVYDDNRTSPRYVVPEGHFFVLGDNRDNSTDSRYPQSLGGVGFVPYENILGRANLIVFSSAGRSLLDVTRFRGDRWFKVIR